MNAYKFLFSIKNNKILIIQARFIIYIKSTYNLKNKRVQIQFFRLLIAKIFAL